MRGRPKKRTKNETGATTDGRGDPLRKRSAADPPFGILSARRHRCGDGHAVSAGAQTYQPGAPDGHQDPAGAAARPARIPPRPEIRTRGPETAAKHRIPDLGLRPADAAVSGAGSPRGMASARFYHGVVPHPAEIGSHAAEHPFPYRVGRSLSADGHFGGPHSDRARRQPRRSDDDMGHSAGIQFPVEHPFLRGAQSAFGDDRHRLPGRAGDALHRPQLPHPARRGLAVRPLFSLDSLRHLS